MIMKKFWHFVKTAWLSYKGVSLWFNLKSYIAEKVVNPVFRLLFYSFLLIYGYKTAENAVVYIIANAMLLATISAFKGIGIIFFSERHQGTLIFSIVAPKSKFKVMVEKMPFHIIDAFLTVLMGMVIIMLFFHFSISLLSMAELFLCVITGVISISMFGMLIAGLGLITRDINMLLSVAESMIFLLSGVYFPVEKLPPLLRYVSYILPLTHSVKGIKQVFSGNTSKMLFSIGMEVFLILVYLLLSFVTLKILETKARSSGEIEFY